MSGQSAWQPCAIAEVSLFQASFKQFRFARHWHEQLALGVILSGAEGLDYCGQRTILQARDVVAINPGEVHTGYSCSKAGWSYRMLYLDPSWLSNTLANYGICALPEIEQPKLQDPLLFKSLLQLHHALQQPSFSLSQHSLLQQVCERLLTCHTAAPVQQVQNIERRHNRQVRDYIEQTPPEQQVTLDELCQLTDLSPSHLIRSFQQQYHLTPHQYLVICRVSVAAKLLTQGYSATYAALESGFCDASHLSRNFKRVMGTSPGAFSRAQCQPSHTR